MQAALPYEPVGFERLDDPMAVATWYRIASMQWS
jgi:hypothetical protein